MTWATAPKKVDVDGRVLKGIITETRSWIWRVKPGDKEAWNNDPSFECRARLDGWKKDMTITFDSKTTLKLFTQKITFLPGYEITIPEHNVILLDNGRYQIEARDVSTAMSPTHSHSREPLKRKATTVDDLWDFHIEEGGIAGTIVHVHWKLQSGQQQPSLEECVFVATEDAVERVYLRFDEKTLGQICAGQIPLVAGHRCGLFDWEEETHENKRMVYKTVADDFQAVYPHRDGFEPTLHYELQKTAPPFMMGPQDD